MSRIGKSPVTIPSGVNVKVDGNKVTVKGPKGELYQEIDSCIAIHIEDNIITFTRESDAPDHRSKHGLYRALINNMIGGVLEGYKKDLEVIGVGYRANATGQQLELALGYSHPIVFELPSEIKVSTLSEKGKAPVIALESIDKQLVGQVAAKIRSFRKPEPYKGKGIRFVGEEIRRKAGKSAGKK
jgi:large subunit ribosomal protein L6